MTNTQAQTPQAQTPQAQTNTGAGGTGGALAPHVGWFEIHTADPDRARGFYGSVLGWTFDEMMPGYSAIGQKDAIVQGGMADTSGNYPNDLVFCVEVTDLSATMAAVTEAGGSVVAEEMTQPSGLRFSYVADPDGSVFGLYSLPPAA